MEGLYIFFSIFLPVYGAVSLAYLVWRMVAKKTKKAESIIFIVRKPEDILVTKTHFDEIDSKRFAFVCLNDSAISEKYDGYDVVQLEKGEVVNYIDHLKR